ncbi:MAG: hypothetical protein PHH77_10195 [Victivallaceae bacterium]|nr:hypothetical protein [Victivallaceae bacterium]
MKIFIKNHPVSPDPWEPEISREQVNQLQQEVCVYCAAPVKAGQYYCSRCFNATGRYVPYLPFVNIPFNYSIYQTLWKKLSSENIGWFYKTGVILFILWTAGIMFIGYFLVLLAKGIKYIRSGIRSGFSFRR